MGLSSSIGRIGGLAAALGVATVFAAPGVAWADADTSSSDSSRSSGDAAGSVSRQAGSSSGPSSRSHAGSRMPSRTAASVGGAQSNRTPSASRTANGGGALPGPMEYRQSRGQYCDPARRCRVSIRVGRQQ